MVHMVHKIAPHSLYCVNAKNEVVAHISRDLFLSNSNHFLLYLLSDLVIRM